MLYLVCERGGLGGELLLHGLELAGGAAPEAAAAAAAARVLPLAAVDVGAAAGLRAVVLLQ